MSWEMSRNPDGGFSSAYLDGRKLDTVLPAMKEQNVRNVAINEAYGWVEGMSFDFLIKNDWIEGLTVRTEYCDLTPLNSLRNLKFLSVSSPNLTGKLDFNNFPGIEYLDFDWQKGAYTGMETNINCQYVYINKLPSKDLAEFAQFKRLKTLKLDYTKLEDLSGIEDLDNLETLFIYSAPKLTSINLSDKVAAKMWRFSLEKCKRVKDYRIVEKMLNLDSLYFAECGPIHSVDFLRNMHKLRYAYIGVDILDRNVSYLKERGFEFKNARSYA